MSGPQRRRRAPAPRTPRPAGPATTLPEEALPPGPTGTPPPTTAHRSLDARFAPSLFPELPAPSADAERSEPSPKDRSRDEIQVVAGWLIDCCRELDRLCQEAILEPYRSPVGDPSIFERVIGTLSSEASRLVNLVSEPTHDDLVVIIETKQGEPIGPPLRRVWDADLEKYRFVDVPPQLALIAATIDPQCCDFFDFGVVEFHWRQDHADFAGAL